MKDEELESFKFGYCGFCGHIHNFKHDACLYPENNRSTFKSPRSKQGSKSSLSVFVSKLNNIDRSYRIRIST
jgi:hypothetical protein